MAIEGSRLVIGPFDTEVCSNCTTVNVVLLLSDTQASLSREITIIVNDIPRNAAAFIPDIPENVLDSEE